jgi:hypothetical protein
MLSLRRQDEARIDSRKILPSRVSAAVLLGSRGISSHEFKEHFAKLKMHSMKHVWKVTFMLVSHASWAFDIILIMHKFINVEGSTHMLPSCMAWTCCSLYQKARSKNGTASRKEERYKQHLHKNKNQESVAAEYGKNVWLASM